MSEKSTIRVNFGRPMPVFPLNTVTLLPHGVIPLHIFEERYRQMVRDALDGPGQIAMGVFDGDGWQQQYHGRPPVRRAVCIGQIVEHVRLPDGRYNIAIQGVCRARIVRELPPEEGRLYREAMLEPVGFEPTDDEALGGVRLRLVEAFSEGPLTDLRQAELIVQHLEGAAERGSDEAATTSAILELIALSVVAETESRYRLLAEGDVMKRAVLVEGELRSLADLLRRAAPQRLTETPKGCTWN